MRTTQLKTTGIVALMGTVLAAAVVSAPLAASASPLDDMADDLLLHYDFVDPVADTTIDDLSGNGLDGTLVGTGATADGDALVLNGDAHVTLPTGMFDGQDTLTISAWLAHGSGSENRAAVFFGTAGSPPAQYWLLNPANPDGRYKSVITNSLDAGAPWTTETGISPTNGAQGVAGPVTDAQMHLYTTVLTATSITAYLDGEKVGTYPLTRSVTDFGTDLVGFIGRSSYNDPNWTGTVEDVKVYTAAMTDQQAALQYYDELGDPVATQAAVDEDAADLSVPDTVVDDITLPVTGANGSTITWTSSDPSVIATDGTVNTPSNDDIEVTLTADLELLDTTATRDFTVTVTGDLAATLLLHYDFTDEIGDGFVSDLSGNGNDGEVLGAGATVDTVTGVLSLPGGANGSGAGYVELPNGMFDGENTLTISAWLRNDTGPGDYAAMFFGTAGHPPAQYWLLNPQNPAGRFKTVMTNGLDAGAPWGTEYGISAPSPRGVPGPLTDTEWALHTTVITPTSISGYYNGEHVGTVTVARTVSQFGTNLDAYLGRSSYADRFFEGDFRDVKVYTSALTSQQISTAYFTEVGDPSAVVAALEEDADAINIDGTSVITDISLPTTGGNGSDIEWASSHPGIVATDGTVVRPASENTTVTLTATLTLAGETLVRSYDVTVIADTPQADLDYLASTYDLAQTVVWDDVSLATDYEGLAVTWESSAPGMIDTTGAVTLPAEQTEVTLTATFDDGSLTTDRVFDVTVIAETAGYIGTGIGTGNTDDTDNLRLAASTDGSTFAALNDGQGILFPELGSRKMGSPTLFRHPDGGFGLVATLDSNSNQLYVFDSENLRSYSNERLVQYAPPGVAAARVAVEYDNAIAAFRLHFTSIGDGLHYEVTTADFVDFTEPEEVMDAPSFASGAFPAGYIETDALAVTQDEYDYVLDRLSRVFNDGVESFDSITVNEGDPVDLPVSANVEYSNGTTTPMPVEWDTAGIDWSEPGTYEVDGTVTPEVYPSPFVERRADPDVTIGDDGLYYFTGSYPMTNASDPEGYDRIILRRADTIAGLGTAQEYTIWDESSEAGLNSYIWAPELAQINGEWYILFTAARSGGFDIRPAMLHFTGEELSGPEAMDASNWETLGYNVAHPDDSIAFSRFSLDMTHFEHNGVDYAIWAEADAEGYSTMRMAPMDSSDPLNMSGESIQITKPTRAWEQASGVEVNEGAAVLKNDGKIIISFSSASVDTHYNISVLWADENADLMDPASWNKLGYPLLTTADVPGEFGPGHNSFTVDALGNPVMVYHSRTVDDTSNPGEATDGGLYDPRRHARAKIVNFDVDGLPILDMTPTEQLDPALADVTVTVTVEADEPPAPSFPDVPESHPFFDEITWLAQEEITGGYVDGSFRPTASVSRQAMAAFMYRLEGEPAFADPSDPTFTDVPDSSTFFSEIEWLNSTGVTTGYTDGTFRPSASVTRQAMAAFLYRLAGEPEFEAPADASFTDVPVTHTFFAEVEWLASTGITTGYEDGGFRPSNEVSRQAMAAFLYRYVNDYGA